jgi:uncharacterized delta-60 repeat protein
MTRPPSSRIVIRPAAVLLVSSLCAVPGVRADGMLDPSFGNGGLVVTDFSPGPGPSYDGASSLVVLPDGRAVAAGRAGDVKPPGAMAAARYLPSGALDTTFGPGGLVGVSPTGCEVGFGGLGNGAEEALLQPDGRLVMVGMCSNFDPGGGFVPVFWIVRLNVDGTLDQSFGAGGQVYLPFPQSQGGTVTASVTGLLQPDGRIVVVGWRDMVLGARFNPDGSLDPTFGNGGQVTLPLAEAFLVGRAALQPDGKLVIAGRYGSPGPPSHDFGLLRLLADGAPDPSFDGDGLVVSDFGFIETGRSVIVLGDGRLVLGGYRGAPSLSDFALVRYLADGKLDTSFGTGGLATADAGGQEIAGQVIELPNAKYFLVGRTAEDFLLARFHTDGGLDTSFGTGGFLQTSFPGSLSEVCAAVAVVGPDLILTAGTASTAGEDNDFALARYIATTPVELLSFEVE